MKEEPHNFSGLRAVVLKISSMLPVGSGGLNEHLSDSNRGTLQPSLTSGESQKLALLIYLSAIRVLSTNGSLRLLGSSHSKPNSHYSLSSSDLQFVAVELHERFSLLCPSELLNVLPGPAGLKELDWMEAWSLLGDPGISAHWADQSSLGFVYQFFSTPLRRESQSSLQSANKRLSLRKLIAFTQLYTPNWVVDFLLENTVLPQWSGTVNKRSFDFLLSDGGRAINRDASAIDLIDPACGSGHFLLRAYDLFLKLYEQEGWSAKDAARSILRNNLAGADIDPAALWIAAFSLMLKTIPLGGIDDSCHLNLVCAQADAGDNLLGSLASNWVEADKHPLASKHHAVVTNPPYIGRKLLDRNLKQALKESFRDCHQDLCAAFIQRGLELLNPGGRLGLIGQSSLMYLPSYGDFRRHLIDRTRLVTIVEAGPGVFPLQGGEKVNSALYVIESDNGLNEKCAETLFFDLVNSQEKPAKLKQLIQRSEEPETDSLYRKAQASFNSQRKNAFNYKCPSFLPDFLARCSKLAEIADLRQGLATSDNKRFIRYKWQVPVSELGQRWFPYAKGAGSERWWAPIDCVVDWQDDGAAIKEAVARSYPYLKGKTAWVVKNERFYFQEGLTFSFVGTRGLAVRRLPAGCIFDVGGSAIFADKGELDFLLAYLNSSFISAVAKLLNPTINFQIGDLKQLPVLSFSDAEKNHFAALAKRCCTHKISLLEPIVAASPAPGSQLPAALSTGGTLEQLWLKYDEQLSTAQRELAASEQEIDELVIETVLRQLQSTAIAPKQLTDWIASQTGLTKRSPIPATSAADFAKYAVFCLFHQQRLAPPATSNAILPSDLPLPEIDAVNSNWLEAQIGLPLADYFKNGLGADLLKRFHGKPPAASYWSGGTTGP